MMCFSLSCSLSLNRLKNLSDKYRILNFAILLKTQKILEANEEELNLLQSEIDKLKLSHSEGSQKGFIK